MRIYTDDILFTSNRMRHHHKSKIYVADIVFILFKVKVFRFSFIQKFRDSEFSLLTYKLLEKPLCGTLNYYEGRFLCC